MANLSLVVLKGRKNVDGLSQVKVRVYHNLVTKYINTGILVKESEFKNGVVVRRSDREYLNTQLKRIFTIYYDRYNSIEYTDVLSCNQLVDLLKEGGADQNRTFESICEEYVSQMEDDREKSKKLYRLAAAHFSRYCGEGFILRHLSPVRMNGFISYLQGEKLSHTTIRIYVTLVKVIITYAEKMKYVDFPINPFVTAKVPSSKKRDTGITVEQMRKIRDADIDEYNVSTCRDIFMLTYYLAGMNLVDLLEYDFRNTDQMDYVRKKTRNTKSGENRITFTIPEEAWDIINKYMDRETGRVVFGRYSTYDSCYNVMARKMGKIAEIAGIRHDFTLYSARKSFVQHGFDLGISLSTLEYCIGHTMKDSRPIFNYFTIMKRHADNAIRMILDNLKGNL